MSANDLTWRGHELKHDDTGVAIEQSIEIGFSGFASRLDPVFRLLFSKRFSAAKDEHVRTEFEL